MVHKVQMINYDFAALPHPNIAYDILYDKFYSKDPFTYVEFVLQRWVGKGLKNIITCRSHNAQLRVPQRLESKDWRVFSRQPQSFKYMKQ